MKRASSPVLALALVSAVALTGCDSGDARDTTAGQPVVQQDAAPGQAGQTQARDVISGWPEESREVATEAIGKYGDPAEVTPTMLIWHNQGPWKRVVAYRDVVQHNFPMPHPDVLEGFIDYQIPPEMADDLLAFTGSVIVDRTKGEISARCDKEGANFLSLNLVHDIVNGRRTVAQARQFYGEAMQAMMGGNPPPYTQGFQFDLPRGGTADPGQSIM
jgi:hypothetical protein